MLFFLSPKVCEISLLHQLHDLFAGEFSGIDSVVVPGADEVAKGAAAVGSADEELFHGLNFSCFGWGIGFDEESVDVDLVSSVIAVKCPGDLVKFSICEVAAFFARDRVTIAVFDLKDSVVQKHGQSAMVTSGPG